MAQKWTSEQVESYLRPMLESQGYGLSAPLLSGHTGADIIAKKSGDALFIEAIGYKEDPAARSKDFYEVFFRAVSRIKDGATQCVVALPAQFGVGMQQRVNQYGVAWERLGDSFPELSIWLVDTDGGSHTEHDWNEWV